MRFRDLATLFPAQELLVGIILLGAVLLSGLVHYRSVKILRFLEPALAMSQPRADFREGIRQLFIDAFGDASVPGVGLSSESIMIDERLILTDTHHRPQDETRIAEKLGSVFLGILEDRQLRNTFDFIMVTTRYPGETDGEQTVEERRQLRERNDLIIGKLLATQPTLAAKYAGSFLPVTRSLKPGVMKGGVVEFRFIPTGRMHIQVLQKLERYAR